MGKGDIKLHPVYGLNPTMPVCLFCGRETGEIALLGAAYDGEAPKHMALTDEPCNTCKSEWAVGIAIIERDMNTMRNTGRVIVITEDALRRMLKPGPGLDQVLVSRGMYVTQQQFSHLVPQDH